MSQRKKCKSSTRKKAQARRNKDIMDDVMAQLHRQREQQSSKLKTNKSNNPPLTDSIGYTPKSIGHFRYDPVLKRYLPKTAYISNGNNDVCIQRIQKASMNGKKSTKLENRSQNANEGATSSCGIFTDKEICRVVFRGCCLRHNYEEDQSLVTLGQLGREKRSKKPKKLRKYNNVANHSEFSYKEDSMRSIPPVEHSDVSYQTFACSERSIVLLVTSLSYCSSSRRHDISSILAQLSFTRRLRAVSTVATRNMLLKRNRVACTVTRKENGWNSMSSILNNPMSDCDQWYSMLWPLTETVASIRQNQINSEIPFDCRCKSYLHPTASTFDILPGDDGTALPHVVTLLDSKSIHYRPSLRVPLCGYESFSVQTDVDYNENGGNQSLANQVRGIKIDEVVSGKIYSIRLTKLKQQVRHDMDGLAVAYLSHDQDGGHNYFSLHKLSIHPTRRMFRLDSERNSTINDFCYSSSNPSMVAFASTKEGWANVSFLNLEASSSFSNDNFRWSRSDPLCVQYRNNQASDQLIFGHRDGTVAIVDSRSADSLITLKCDSFGSVSSIQQFNKEHLILAKGSFGSCRLFDIRRQNTSIELRAPSDVHNTKSINCTGVTIDPTESFAIAPYVTQVDNIMAAVWSIGTGKLLRTIKLEGAASGLNEDCPLFCELNSTTTCGFNWNCADRKSIPVITRSRWGIWYKSRSSITDAPAIAGGIHHISLE